VKVRLRPMLKNRSMPFFAIATGRKDHSCQVRRLQGISMCRSGFEEEFFSGNLTLSACRNRFGIPRNANCWLLPQYWLRCTRNSGEMNEAPCFVLPYAQWLVAQRIQPLQGPLCCGGSQSAKRSTHSETSECKDDVPWRPLPPKFGRCG
jgi:hypothetical protein